MASEANFIIFFTLTCRTVKILLVIVNFFLFDRKEAKYLCVQAEERSISVLDAAGKTPLAPIGGRYSGFSGSEGSGGEMLWYKTPSLAPIRGRYSVFFIKWGEWG